MHQPQRTNRMDIAAIDFERLLGSLKKEGKPLILTEQGRGVAALVPYTDPAALIKDEQHKRF